MSTMTIPSHVEIDIIRPTGEIETVRPAQFCKLTDRDFARIADATAKAGRGKCIAYRNVTKSVEDTVSNDPGRIAEIKYINDHNAIIRAGAGGEKCDRIGGANDTDKTPANKTDY